ncbi:MAG: argininosuccinate synthase [Candidatus Latescibacterota bacterium]|nr:MAG: argininosuccinate synthase [Candidatus Latescibacterota bacterium]
MTVAEIERKIEAVPTPRVNKVAAAFSGGLDSSLSIELLRRKYKAKEIVPITVDIGQGDEELEQSKLHARALGIEPIFIDVKEEFANQWVSMAIKANSDYEGYPVSTSMTRQLIARKVAEKAVELGCDALIEGSSGKGNDQYRMHNVFTLFAPGLEVLVPVRDFDLTRGEEELLCKAWGVPVTETLPGGDDKTMWCRSIASGAVDLNQELPEEIWMWLVAPEEAKDQPTIVEIEFSEGIPVSLNGKQLPLAELILQLNVIGGENGIGRIDMFEDGIMSLKSREIYEAPAAKIILALHRDLEQFCLTKEEIMFKKAIDQQWAYMMYHGEAFHPLRYELEAFINQSQKPVNGEYKVKLYKGNIEILGRSSQSGLFAPEIRSIKAGGFDQRMCRDAAHIRALPYRVLAEKGRAKYL